MKRIAVLLFSLTMSVLIVAGCSSSSSSTTRSGAANASTATAQSGAAQSGATGSAACPSKASGFAKTKFVAHAGLAFGAFHRYIYKPFRAGSFKSGASGRIKTFLKAGVAALFVKREVRLSYEAAQKSPALCKVIAAPLQKIGNTISSAVSGLKRGDLSGISAVEGAINTVKGKASGQGNSITEPSNVSI